MSKLSFPSEIESFLKNRPYSLDTIGQSDSSVLMFDDCVLKIQKHSENTDSEVKIIRWAENRIPVPKILAYEIKDEKAYTLMSRIQGKMLCDEEYMNQPELLCSLAASGLKSLWSADISDCPVKRCLDVALRQARYNVENNLVDLDSVEPETFGSDGFENPSSLLQWLEDNRPKEDLVLTHGDYCLPNVFASGASLAGFIDLGFMGIADRWQDAALCMRSLRDNFAGAWTGKKYSGYSTELFLEKLGIPFDEKKFKYYLLLDELF